MDSFWSLKVQLNFTIIIKFPLIFPFDYSISDWYIKYVFLSIICLNNFFCKAMQCTQFSIECWQCNKFCYIMLDAFFQFIFIWKPVLLKIFRRIKVQYIRTFHWNATWRARTLTEQTNAIRHITNGNTILFSSHILFSFTCLPFFL